MSAPVDRAQKVVPAQVGFLAIYNPSLGPTDETLDDQIVYYSSPETRGKQRRRRRTSEDAPPKSSQEERNERLRKIGLAQGMVEFGRDFSEGKAIDTIETVKSRIVLHELESGWWLLVSIDLTRLPTFKGSSGGVDAVEYSSREVKPPLLLLQDLLRAHSTFLLHHASSLSALFVRTRRSKFVNLLGRYWDSFLSTWNVMLHGNPLVNVYGGIKLASSGELGVGVGEEDRGSGEREVLEGFIGRIDGLVDLVVSRFEGPELEKEERIGSKDPETQTRTPPPKQWLGTGAEPTPEDGAIFLGVGALSRKSLRDVAQWMEDVYTWGSRAYGVRDNPTATRKSRKRERRESASVIQPLTASTERPSHANLQLRPGLHPTASREQPNSPTRDQATASSTQGSYDSQGMRRPKEKRPQLQRGPSSQSSAHSVANTGGRLVSYLKLGYGTHWSLGGNTGKNGPDHGQRSTKQEPNGLNQTVDGPTPRSISAQQEGSNADDGSDSSPPFSDSVPHYLIGLTGDIESDEHYNEEDSATETDDGGKRKGNYRMLLRTVTVELEREGDARPEADISIDLGTADNGRSHSSKYGGSEHTGTSHASFESQDRNKTKKLRIVVYVNKPFIFAFFFELRTDALALTNLYRSLHYQLGPLQHPLLASTSRPLSRPDISTTTKGTRDKKDPIYDLLWDSKSLAISSTIPSIPEPQGAPNTPTKLPTWSRIEALNTHMQLLNTFSSTRLNRSELENTCKTSRGWWIVWTRIPDPDTGSVSNCSPSPIPGSATPQLGPEDSAKSMGSGNASITAGTANFSSTYSGSAHPFLDRASAMRDRPVPKDKEIFLLRRASDHSGTSNSMELKRAALVVPESWGAGSAKLAQGIGVDTKRYIDGLLNMNR